MRPCPPIVLLHLASATAGWRGDITSFDVSVVCPRIWWRFMMDDFDMIRDSEILAYRALPWHSVVDESMRLGPDPAVINSKSANHRPSECHQSLFWWTRSGRYFRIEIYLTYVRLWLISFAKQDLNDSFKIAWRPGDMLWRIDSTVRKQQQIMLDLLSKIGNVILSPIAPRPYGLVTWTPGDSSSTLHACWRAKIFRESAQIDMHVAAASSIAIATVSLNSATHASQAHAKPLPSEDLGRGIARDIDR